MKLFVGLIAIVMVGNANAYEYGNVCTNGAVYTVTSLKPIGTLCINTNGGNVGKIQK